MAPRAGPHPDVVARWLAASSFALATADIPAYGLTRRLLRSVGGGSASWPAAFFLSDWSLLLLLIACAGALLGARLSARPEARRAFALLSLGLAASPLLLACLVCSRTSVAHAIR